MFDPISVKEDNLLLMSASKDVSVRGRTERAELEAMSVASSVASVLSTDACVALPSSAVPRIKFPSMCFGVCVIFPFSLISENQLVKKEGIVSIFSKILSICKVRFWKPSFKIASVAASRS